MIKISGFVPQYDLAVESLTVQEHMEFMVGIVKGVSLLARNGLKIFLSSFFFLSTQARMRMDRRYREGIRKLRISALMTELALINCANAKLSALSGGEKKRVSLAVQVSIIDPIKINIEQFFPLIFL